MPKYRHPLRAAAGLRADEIFTAAQSFSGSPYRWVTPGSIYGEVVLATGASNGTPIGVIQNTPAAGEPAKVRVFGKSIVAASPGACNLNHGTFITVGSHANALASTCGLVLARWAGSQVLSGAGGVYGEAFIAALGFAACAPSTS